MLAAGASYSTIEATVPSYRDYINRWLRPKPCGPSELVLKDRARSPGPRHLHIRRRLGAQDSPIHPALQQGSEADPLGVSQPGASN